MPNFSKLVSLTVAAAFALSTADAASLRIGNSKSLVSSLSASHSRALKALTAKYDCDLGATNLVDTLKEVTSKNRAADAALSKACTDFQAGYAADLKAKLAEADSLAGTAQKKGDDVYAAAESAAKAAFKAVLKGCF